MINSLAIINLFSVPYAPLTVHLSGAGDAVTGSFHPSARDLAVSGGHRERAGDDCPSLNALTAPSTGRGCQAEGSDLLWDRVAGEGSLREVTAESRVWVGVSTSGGEGAFQAQ